MDENLKNKILKLFHNNKNITKYLKEENYFLLFIFMAEENEISKYISTDTVIELTRKNETESIHEFKLDIKKLQMIAKRNKEIQKVFKEYEDFYNNNAKNENYF